MRKIAVMIGSDSDLPQCVSGLEYLAEAEKKGLATVARIITNSIHRNTNDVLCYLRDFRGKIDVLVAGAGMANHLTGIVDAFLRYSLRDDKIVVIGVAFEGKTETETRAAINSIIYVPETQVVFDDFVGARGFYRACEFAVIGELPKITLKEAKPVKIRVLEQAIEAAKEKLKEKEEK